MAVTIEHIRTFVAVADMLSFSQAAQRLKRSQPLISTQIAQLEAKWKVELFDRSTRTVTLTPQGKALLGEALGLLHQYEQLQERLIGLDEDPESCLNIGIGTGLSWDPLLNIFQSFSEIFPSVRIRMMIGLSSNVREWVLQRQVHIGLTFEEAMPLPSGIISKRISAIRQVLVASASHPLSQLQSVTHNDLTKYRQILVRNSIMPQTEETRKIFSPQCWETTSPYMAQELTARGVGWTLLPVSLVLQGEKANRLRILPFEDIVFPDMGILLFWNRGHNTRSKAVIWLCNKLEKVLSGTTMEEAAPSHAL